MQWPTPFRDAKISRTSEIFSIFSTEFVVSVFLNSDSEQLFNTSTPKNGRTSGGGETVIIVSARPEQAFDKISDQHCI